MHRIVVACLLVVIAFLPAIDVVYCPDGCGDEARTPCAWQAGAVSSHDGCGICLNGVAISQPPLYVPPARRHHRIDRFVPPSFVSSTRPALERPPRLA